MSRRRPRNYRVVADSPSHRWTPGLIGANTRASAIAQARRFFRRLADREEWERTDGQYHWTATFEPCEPLP